MSFSRAGRYGYDSPFSKPRQTDVGANRKSGGQNLRTPNKGQASKVSDAAKSTVMPPEQQKGRGRCPPRKHSEKMTKRERAIKNFKNIDFSREDSNLQLTVQNIEFPDVNIRRTELHKRDECGRSLVIQKADRDLRSSSNSHFREGIETVKLRKRSCTDSNESVSGSTQAISSRISARAFGFLNSQEMIDSQHVHSVRAPNFRGPEWMAPCVDTNVLGAPRPHIGKCPENYEKLAKLSIGRQKFFLTQDPRKTHCLVNPQALRHTPLTKKQEFDLITKTVKHGDNVCVDTESETSASYICEVMDVENPMNLDFQGMDYKKTYEADEQALQNELDIWRINRFMERKHVKQETQERVEKKLQEERLAVPPAFATKIKYDPPVEKPKMKSPRLSELYRRADKMANKRQIELEAERRTSRYKDIYLRNKQRQQELEQERQKQEEIAKEIEARTVAENDMLHDVAIIDDAIERSFRKNVEIKPVIRKRKFFPKTLAETNRLKKIMYQESCVLRDTARVKQQFYLRHTGKLKYYPDVKLKRPCEGSADESVGSTPSEQSSDDEDYLQVGKMGSKFQLRGFHFKHGSGLRGKLHRHQILQGKRVEKKCLTRDEWLNQLAPKKEPVKLDVETGILKVRDPDDPNLDLFPPVPIIKPLNETKSAVREFVNKRLGLHYHRLLRKNIKLVKPKLKYNVKKFNLIRYIFPEPPLMDLSTEVDEDDEVAGLDPTKVKTTVEYMDIKKKIAKAIHKKKKLRRMKLLGLPCIEHPKRSMVSPCERREPKLDLDWVPDPEPPYGEEPAHEPDTEAETEMRMSGGEYVPAELRGNMPAPKLREPTIVVHPRRQRNYGLERVPTEMFHVAMRKLDMPLLEKLPEDIIIPENVRSKKRPFTKFLEARHHHDHWSPVQFKTAHVHYEGEIVKPKITEFDEVQKKNIEHFTKAHPKCMDYVDEDLTMPKYDFDKMIAEHLAATRTDTKEGDRVVVKDLCRPYDVVYHSREPNELAQAEYPGRQQYLDFLREMRETLYESKAIEPGDERLFVDKKALENELEADLKSIEGCLSSLSSSDCTNLTNDSGSFLLIEGKTKIPLDYIRKPLVPFEELRRTRFQASVIDVDAEKNNPYRVLPFAGQRREQRALFGPTDKFFTFSSRLRNEMRLRLEVPVPDVRNTLLGPGTHQYYGSVITDLDENYIEELKSRAIVKSFNFKTGSELLKDSLRLKYESLLIQGQMVRTKVYDRLNERHWQDMKKTKMLYDALFAKWEKKEYNAAMTVVYQVKSYYETTDKLKHQYRDLERELMMLNMDIVFIEGHWIRCIMLQNFHYLLGEQEWRLENDWIHLIPKAKREKEQSIVGLEECDEEQELEGEEEEEDIEYELEPYDESIAKRAIVNIRARDKDDAWAIRAFYYDVYMKNLHPILQVFPDAESFLHGIENLKNKTFVLLLEMHFTLSVHTELQGRLETFIDWCTKDLKEKQEYVARKSAKRYFMEGRAIEMENRVRTFLDKPIEDSFNDDVLKKNRAIIAEVWRRIVPTNVRGGSDVVPNSSDMIAALSEVILELIARFEHLDIDVVREMEKKLRKRRRYLEKLSYQAYHVERRIELDMKKVRHNLEPPYKKPKRVGRLPRLFFKKREKVEVQKVIDISENTKYFIRAFKEDGVLQDNLASDSLIVVDTMQEHIVPFYFDYFLKLNGYTPNYNFKTNIEMRDGPEIDRFNVRDVIPDVLQKLEQWEATRKQIMEENIQRNPKMYENVV